MPKFFDYPEVIKNELIGMGNDVDFVDDRPSTKGFIKAIIRLNKNIISIYIKKYFRNIMKQVKEQKYDVVLLISGQSLSFSKEMMRELKTVQSEAEFILYQWDSTKNFPYISTMYDLFEKRFSFDYYDCKANPDLQFLPLFYSPKYEEIGKMDRNKYLYDYSFVGTAHPKKFQLIKEIDNKLLNIYKKRFVYYYYPSRIVYYYRKLFSKELRNAHKKDFHFKALSYAEMCQIISDSRIILDSPQEGQTGLTIRTFETLGAKRKLITTNVDIKNYDFYRKENIYIYQDFLEFDDPFFTAPFKELEPDIYNKYSLRSWIGKILEAQDSPDEQFDV